MPTIPDARLSEPLAGERMPLDLAPSGPPATAAPDRLEPSDRAPEASTGLHRIVVVGGGAGVLVAKPAADQVRRTAAPAPWAPRGEGALVTSGAGPLALNPDHAE